MSCTCTCLEKQFLNCWILLHRCANQYHFTQFTYAHNFIHAQQCIFTWSLCETKTSFSTLQTLFNTIGKPVIMVCLSVCLLTGINLDLQWFYNCNMSATQQNYACFPSLNLGSITGKSCWIFGNAMLMLWKETKMICISRLINNNKLPACTLIITVPKVFFVQLQY